MMTFKYIQENRWTFPSLPTLTVTYLTQLNLTQLMSYNSSPTELISDTSCHATLLTQLISQNSSHLTHLTQLL